jgi:hypothetical protein
MIPLEIFEVSPTTFREGDVDTLKDIRDKAIPGCAARRAALDEASAHEQGSEETLGKVEALAERSRQTEKQVLVNIMDEAASTTDACDVQGLASTWRKAHDETTVWQETANLLRFKRIPAARLRRLEATLSLRKIEAVLAGVLASLSHAETIAKLVTAGVFQNENRVALISEETERARALSKECDRQVGLAEDALRDERTRQAVDEQRRVTVGAITRAEVASAIPSYQA